jgi:hypothetical protein
MKHQKIKLEQKTIGTEAPKDSGSSEVPDINYSPDRRKVLIMTNLPSVIEYTHRKINRKGDGTIRKDSLDSHRIEEEDYFDSIADAKPKPKRATTLARKITRDVKKNIKK